MAHVSITLDGERLMELAGERGWNQRDLAEQLGWHETYLSHLRHGRKQLGRESIARIGSLFPDHRNEIFREHREVTVTTDVSVRSE